MKNVYLSMVTVLWKLLFHIRRSEDYIFDFSQKFARLAVIFKSLWESSVMKFFHTSENDLD